MQTAIDFLKSKAASVKFQADMVNSSGDLATAGALAKEADEYLKAAQVLEFYMMGRDKSMSPDDIVKEVQASNERCGGLVHVRDCEDGLIHMDVTFYPHKDDMSPAHQSLARVVAIMNQTNVPL